MTLIGPSLPWRRMCTRATLIAAVVGSALVLINHGDHLCEEPVCAGFFWKLALSYAVPFTVSLASTALTLRDVTRRRSAS